jgi:undecaprenyl-diphosphatase
MNPLVLVKAAVLGIVEGVTEFLPVSSTGHLIIVARFLHLSTDERFVAAFEVVIQLGAILAIVVLFWTTLWPWARVAAERSRVWSLWLRVLVGIIPAFAAGFLLEDWITTRLFTPLVVAIALAFYGAVLIVFERFVGARPPSLAAQGDGAPLQDVTAVSPAAAFAIGLFQTLALVPGTSRAAVTIIGGMVMGLSRGAAAEFSFFLAIPVMAGASALTLLRHGLGFSGSEWLVLAVGFVVAFLSALLVVKAFLAYLRKHNLRAFGWYRIALAVLVAVLLVRGR